MALTITEEFDVGGSSRTLPDEAILDDCTLQVQNIGTQSVYLSSSTTASYNQGVRVGPGEYSPVFNVVGTANSGQGYISAISDGQTVKTILITNS